MSGTSWGEPREFVSDDPGPGPDPSATANRLVVSMGGNGDWYVSVRIGANRIGPAVRVATSGGASSSYPGLSVAIARAYRALGREATGPADDSMELRGLAADLMRERDALKTERDSMLRELERWRHGMPIEGDYVCQNDPALRPLTVADALQDPRWKDGSHRIRVDLPTPLVWHHAGDGDPRYGDLRLLSIPEHLHNVIGLLGKPATLIPASGGPDVA